MSRHAAPRPLRGLRQQFLITHVENGLHWVLDVVFREDECRIRRLNGPANFATVRHMALNLLQRTVTLKKKSVRVKRGLAAISDDFLASVLSAP